MNGKSSSRLSKPGMDEGKDEYGRSSVSSPQPNGFFSWTLITGLMCAKQAPYLYEEVFLHYPRCPTCAKVCYSAQGEGQQLHNRHLVPRKKKGNCPIVCQPNAKMLGHSFPVVNTDKQEQLSVVAEKTQSLSYLEMQRVRFSAIRSLTFPQWGKTPGEMLPIGVDQAKEKFIRRALQDQAHGPSHPDSYTSQQPTI